MRYPKFLSQSDTIGVVAPSYSSINTPYFEAFQSALLNFQSLGYKVIVGECCNRCDGTGISSLPDICGRELTEFYCLEDSDVLISNAGGELMCSILDYIDFEKIRASTPKWFMGFSDNTNFTFLLTTLCDVASIYGPGFGAFGMKPWHAAINDALALLRGRKLTMRGYEYFQAGNTLQSPPLLQPYQDTQQKILHSFPFANMSFNGRLIGGCLDSLVRLAGTCFDKVSEFTHRHQEDGIVWFMENHSLNTWSVFRALWQLDHAGWFENVSGFLFGRSACIESGSNGLDQYGAVVKALKKYNVPIVMDVDFGHVPPAMPLICGSLADITVKGNEIEIDMQLK